MNLFHVFKKQIPASMAAKELPYGFKIIPGHSLTAAVEAGGTRHEGFAGRSVRRLMHHGGRMARPFRARGSHLRAAQALRNQHHPPPTEDDWEKRVRELER